MAQISNIERLKILGGILKRIGNFDMNSFEGRLIFQKTIYFLQVFKLYLGYYFSWYIYGPYSVDLTRDGYELTKTFKGVEEIRFVKEDVEKQFNSFVSFLGDRKKDPKWLELLASIHFLKKLHPNKNKEEIIKTLLSKQTYFDKKICEEGWSHLENFNLI